MKTAKITCLLTASLISTSISQGQILIWSATQSGQIWSSGLDGSSPSVYIDIDAATGNSGHEPRKLATRGGKIFWTENNLGVEGIYSANLTGDNVQRIVDLDTTFGSADYGLEGITATDSKLYWTDTAGKKIYTSNLDGSGASVLIDGSSGLINDVTGITTDGSSLFWVDNGFGAIYESGIDGSSPRQILDIASDLGVGFVSPWDVDYDGGSLYFTGLVQDAIFMTDVEEPFAVEVFDTQSVFSGAPFGLDVFEGEIFFGDSQGAGVFKVNVDGTGGAEIADVTSDDRYTLVINPAAVPEPQTYLLMAVGGSFLFIFLRRRK